MIGEHPDSRLVSITDHLLPRYEIHFGGKHSNRPPEIIDAAEFIGLKSFKAKGKRLTTLEVDTITEIEPIDANDEALLKYYGEEYSDLLGMSEDHEDVTDVADVADVADVEDLEDVKEVEDDPPVPPVVDDSGQFTLEW
jgi:topoisomerase-4 subunit A